MGQIHTANFYVRGTGTQLVDLSVPDELSAQLQTLVRQGQFFKIVGIDATVSEYGGNDGGVSVNGFLRYYAPTKGRCEAYRNAFEAMRNAMQLQGIHMKSNPQYDFRVQFNDDSAGTMTNLASLDGTSPLEFYDSSNSPTNPSTTGIFDVYNRSVLPIQTSTPNFSSGFNTMGVQNTATDFVLNDGVIWSGNSDFASTDWETIPFQLSYTPTSGDVAFVLDWKPDPALYLAVLGGLFQLNVEEVELEGDAAGYEIALAIHVSGWKSIMGNPRKSRKSRKSPSRRKSNKRRSKK